MLYPDSIGDWVEIIAGIATAILVFFVYKEFKLTRETTETTVRPWLGLESHEWYFKTAGGSLPSVEEWEKMSDSERELYGKIKERVLHFRFKNFGNIPAISIMCAGSLTTRSEVPTEETLKVLPRLSHRPLMPQEVGTYKMSIDMDTYNDAWSGKIDLYMIFYTEYEFANDRKGIYGTVHSLKDGMFQNIRSWVN